MSGDNEAVALVSACADGSQQSCARVLQQLEAAEPRDAIQDTILDALARAAASSTLATDTLVAALYQQRFARSEIRKVLINDNTAAEEALQETALAVVRSLPNFRGDSTFRTWATTIARNKAIEVLRRLRPTVPLDERDQSEAARFSSMLADRTDLHTALASLPQDFRDVVHLRDIEQQSYQEISDQLGIKLNTVRSRLARGRARLASDYGQDP